MPPRASRRSPSGGPVRGRSAAALRLSIECRGRPRPQVARWLFFLDHGAHFGCFSHHLLGIAGQRKYGGDLDLHRIAQGRVAGNRSGAVWESDDVIGYFPRRHESEMQGVQFSVNGTATGAQLTLSHGSPPLRQYGWSHPVATRASQVVATSGPVARAVKWSPSYRCRLDPRERRLGAARPGGGVRRVRRGSNRAAALAVR